MDGIAGGTEATGFGIRCRGREQTREERSVVFLPAARVSPRRTRRTTKKTNRPVPLFVPLRVLRGREVLRGGHGPDRRPAAYLCWYFTRLPRTLLVDRQSVVRAVDLHGAALDRAMGKLVT